MKKVGFLLLIFVAGCAAPKKITDKDYSNGIVYVLPGNVQKLLAQKNISDNTYYVLKKTNDLQFRIYQEEYNVLTNWIKNTNRYVSISGKLSPLLVEFDDYFANTETAKEFLEDYKKGIFKRTQVTTTRDYTYHIDFTIKGEILYEGH